MYPIKQSIYLVKIASFLASTFIFLYIPTKISKPAVNHKILGKCSKGIVSTNTAKPKGWLYELPKPYSTLWQSHNPQGLKTAPAFLCAAHELWAGFPVQNIKHLILSMFNINLIRQKHVLNNPFHLAFISHVY